uniref:Parthenolide synthase n=1 Tax=Tanacetum parthenium TaxID=127999 RepID=C71A1_TANPA|nr:RecName: Full=Parthenolide synthase; Short=Tp2116; Short=TpPTS; AltName: Full=Cytochrome P450 71CA1 [Tanacetum parthenium]AHM24033.1 parthenolide synthase [Tanacetum parthenium]
MDTSTSFPSLFLPTLCTILISYIIIKYVLIWNRSSMAAFNLPPSPPKLPIIGNIHHVFSKNVNQTLWKLSKKYGPVMLIDTGAKSFLVVSSSQMAMEVLKTHQEILSTRPSNEGTKRLSYNFSDITFSPHGDHWRDMRKVFVNEFLGPKRAGWFNQVLRMEIKDVINNLSSNPLNTSINLNEMLLSLVYRVVCKFAFGKSYREEPFNGVTLKEMLDESMVVLAGSSADMFPTFGWILDKLYGWNDRLEKCFGNLDGFFEMIINEHLQSASETSEDEKDFVHSLVELSLKDPQFTKDYIKALLLNVLLGAIDTTFTTIVWAMSEIVKNTQVMQKLQTEIRSCIGRKEEVDATDLTNMAYLKMVIKETLRLHPPAPLLFPRECPSHCKIGGYDVFPGTCVVMNGWGIARDPNVWKEIPNEFYPERFENFNIDFLGNHCEMIPFGAGRRSCPGMKSATSTIEFTLVNLLYWFDWEVPSGMNNQDLDMEEDGFLVIQKKSPLFLIPIKHI